MRLLVTLLLALVVLAAPAAAAVQEVDTGSAIDEAVEALRSDAVHVDPDAEAAISQADADRLRDRIARGDAGDLKVAILPSGAGDADTMPNQLYEALNQPGTYATVVGRTFRAGSTEGRAGSLASAALPTFRSQGVTAGLLDFTDRLARARAGGRSGGGGSPDAGGGSGAGALGLLALLGGGIGFVAWRSGRRRRKALEQQVAELREAARDDLVALGDDVRGVDLDVEMPDADPRAREQLGRGLQAYERAELLLDRASDPQDFAEITRTIDDGRQAMAACRALLDGREPPERRPPCFFDPRHGPSVEDVEWAPEGYAPRPVPVCAADAIRLQEGYEPQTREVLVGGRPTAYYNAPGYFGPWAGGFFGGGSLFLPGLLAGTMLGGALSGPAIAYGDELGGGDFGGGDFGGGGFGGGDFGGGDFGGGGFGGGDF